MSLETVHPKALVGLRSLRLLSMSQNKLVQLPERLLEPVPKLEKLFLGGKTDKDFHILVEGNSLESFPAGFFTRTPDLTTLDVSENRLRSWTKTFGNLTKLRQLDLRGNVSYCIVHLYMDTRRDMWLKRKGVPI